MGEFERQVRDIAVDRFGSIASFARKADVNYRTLATLFDRGNFANSRYETVSAVATALGVDADMLMQGKYVESPAGNPSFSLVPVCESICPDRLAHITANTPRYPVPDVLASRHPDSFLLHVPDTAMDRIIPKGSYALVTPTDTVAHSSQPYAVCIGEAKAVIRRAYALANGVRLEPDSADPTWHPTTHDFADEDSAPLTIVGRVIWYALPADWRF